MEQIINQLLVWALKIKNETAIGANTQSLVGGGLEKLIGALSDLQKNKADQFALVALENKIDNATIKFKGYHVDEDALKIAHPQANNKKDFFAWVGSPYPGKVYKVKADGGVWEKTEEVPDQQEIDLAAYLKKESLTSEITDDADTVPSNFAVNTLQSKLYGGNDGEVKNICTPSAVIQKYTVNENCILDTQTDAKYSTSGIIAVNGGDKLEFSGLVFFVMVFDSDRKLILKIPVDSTECTLPSDAAFIATNNNIAGNASFCTIKNKGQGAEGGDIPQLKEQVKNVLINKNQAIEQFKKDYPQLQWCIVGDSQSYLNDHLEETQGCVSKGYITRVIDEITNLYPSNLGEKGASTAYWVNKNIPLANVYTIYLGINDWWQGLAIGTPEDFTNKTTGNTLGNLGNIISKVKQVNANAKIIVMNSTDKGDYVNIENHNNTSYGSYKPNSKGFFLKEYSDAIYNTCKANKIACIDLYNLSGITIENAVNYKRMKVNGSYVNLKYPDYIDVPFNAADEYPYPKTAIGTTFDGLHLSDDGHSKVASLLTIGLLKLYYSNTVALVSPEELAGYAKVKNVVGESIVYAKDGKIEVSGGLYNVSEAKNNYNYSNKRTARGDVPTTFRGQGQTITYKLNDGSWVREQFIGVSTETDYIEIFNPSMAIRGYTTEQDGTLQEKSDPKYGTTGFVAVVEGAKIEVVNKSYDLVRMFDANKQFVKEVSGVNEFEIPNGVAYIALNDNVNSSSFCTILTDITNVDNSWSSETNWESISGKASELLKEPGFEIKVNIDDFLGSDIKKINTAIEFVNMSGGGIVEITRDVLIDSSILMHSNVHLLFSATIKVAARTFDNIIRMAGVIVDPRNPNDKCLKLNETTNIKILGVGDSAKIEGCDIPYKGVNPKTGKEEDFVGDFFGWRTISILLSNVKNYEVGNFHITKTKCWAISQEWGCKNGYVHDIEFNTSVKNGDGIDVRNGCRNIRIENLTGYTSDDTVACTALDMSFAGAIGGGNYVWVLQTMGFDYKQGDEAGIFDITISNVNSESEHNVIRCLATTPKVQNISMAKVIGKAVYDVVVIHTGYGNGFVKGNLKDIYVNDVTNTSNARTIGCDAPLVDGWFNKINGIVFVNNNAENVRVTNN